MENMYTDIRVLRANEVPAVAWNQYLNDTFQIEKICDINISLATKIFNSFCRDREWGYFSKPFLKRGNCRY